MNITIKNIALIKKAEIELNGITVVAGLNKTGKTTIGKSLYAMISAYRNLPLRVLNSQRNDIRNKVIRILKTNRELLENTPFWAIEVVGDFVDAIRDNDLIGWSADKEHKGVREYIEKWIHSRKEYEEYILEKR